MEKSGRSNVPQRFKVRKPAERKKSGTQTTKKHRFESFSQRIAKLNVDPIRRGDSRKQVQDENEASHFISALEVWKDTNLSENFTEFVRKVDLFCQSLPQILHYEGHIVELLLEYVGKGDALCLEPLLSLTTHLAHDLGSRFERYFEPTVVAVSRLAAHHGGVEVIEWSFTCLAWLFKYLSRLLVPDLRPLYDLMAPLLGKERHTPFISKFAAESMSFLVRKAATKYHSDTAPLNTIISHAFKDLSTSSDDSKMQYQQGLTVLFAESIKGVQRGTHSGGGAIMKALISHLMEIPSNDSRRSREMELVVESIIIDTIHHTNAQGFAPIADAFLANSCSSTGTPSSLVASARLLLVVMATRKGTRIQTWSGITSRLAEYIDRINSDSDCSATSVIASVSKAIAVALLFAPFDVALPLSQTVMRSIDNDRWKPHFLAFCDFMSGVSKERFETFVLPSFQKFVVSCWENYERQICYILPNMRENGASEKTGIRLPREWESHIENEFGALNNADSPSGNSNLLSLCHGYIRLLDCVESDLDFRQRVAENLLSLIRVTLHENSECRAGSLEIFSICYGLPFAMKSLGPGLLKGDDISKFLKSSRVLGRHLGFLRVLSDILKHSEVSLELNSDELVSVTDTITDNLASPSHDLRRLSLTVLSSLYDAVKKEQDDALIVAQDLEDSPFTVEGARAASLKVRRLASMYLDAANDPWMKRAIPAYCFGLMHVRLTPIWEDLCVALRKMAEVDGAEPLVMDRATLWLKDAPSPDDTQPSLPVEQISTTDTGSPEGLPGFLCTNLSSIDLMSFHASHDIKSAGERLLSAHANLLEPLPVVSPENRAQGLRVLTAMPQLAEKRSRTLVPVLLDWAASLNLRSHGAEDGETDSETLGSNDSPPRLDPKRRWSRKDQKALLELFSQFVNPSVLFRSKDVHDSLLELLCNGDVEIQKSALKAIFTWKSSALIPYRENLFNILDDSRFREEVTTFLDDEDGGGIRGEHRSGLMPILLRLLYGRVTTRSGLGNTRGSQEARRKAVLASLGRFGQESVTDFVAIALGPMRGLSNLFTNNGDLQDAIILNEIMPLRRQAGMLRMLRDVVETLPDQTAPSSAAIAYAATFCLVKSSQNSSSDLGDTSTPENASLMRSVRHEAYACLTLLYAKCPKDEWMNSVEGSLFNRIINPKLENLPIETAQAPSSLLKLFSVWSKSAPTTRLLFEPSPDLLLKVADCLVEPSAKLEVRRFVLKDIIKPSIEHTIAAGEKHSNFPLQSGIAHTLFPRISEVLRHTQDRDCLEACVEVFISLQPFASGFEGTKDVIGIGLKFLSEPSRNVSPRLKGEILNLLQHFIPVHDFHGDPELYNLSIASLSKQFSFFRDAQNRQRLVFLFGLLAGHDESLREPVRICEQLNSYSDSRLNEPNYEQREAAFQVLNDDLGSRFDARQWLPVIHNLLFLIADEEELSTRSSASTGLRRFIQAASLSRTITGKNEIGFAKILTDTVIPAIQAGLQNESELVRNEYLTTLAELIRNGGDSTQDLTCLLSNDDDTSFFNNILHIQPHRRNRAMQRLSAESATLSSLNIGRFFIPLIETLIADKNSEAHNLSMEAVRTLEYLAEGLEWKRYRVLVQRMVQDPQRFSSKIRIRAIGALLTALHRAHMKKTNTIGATVEEDQKSKLKRETSDNLANSLPDDSTLQKSLFGSVLSKLLDQIHYQDEASIDVRILVAVYAVRLILVFPPEEINKHLPAVLVDMCNVLKSRAQEARDSTRKTLADISAIIGPPYFGFVVKQLRSSLKRGYQLHVLSYTVHSLLVSTSSIFKVGSIDYCLPDVVAVIMDDAFGVTGQDKEASGYVSTMREVKKKALGFDSMEILATMVTLQHVSTLLKPIGAHLDRPRPKIDKADELFRRIREGLRRNETVKSRDLLTLCFELMTEAARGNPEAKAMDLRPRKMVGFALELLRRILDKHEELKTPANLGGFLPIFDELAKQTDDEIQMCLFRLLASIIKVPLQQLDEYAGSFIHRAKRTIQNSNSTNEPLAQASLRLISAILRERPAAVIKKSHFETDIAFLLQKITPDLQEPARQGERDRQVAAFNFLKALMARGIVIKEVYDTMDTVREVMITSQETPIPDLARGVYSRFILDYFPEGGKGISKQLDFLITNLQYEHARGRKAVIEVIAFVLNKMDKLSLQPVLVSFFLPLVLTMIVDQDGECRKGAQLLLHRLFERADKERTKLFKSQMIKWQHANTDMLWRKIVLRIWKLFFNVHTTATKEALAVHGHVSDILEEDASDENNGKSLKPLLLGSLELLKCLCDIFPSIAFASNTARVWSTITLYLTSEEPPIRAVTSQLISAYFTDFARTASESSKPFQIPLAGCHGLELTAQTLLPIANASMRLVSYDSNALDTSDRTIQNLAFIGRLSSTEQGSQGILDALFKQSSSILRVEIDASQPPRAKVAALKLVAALCDFVPARFVAPLLHEILVPLHHLTDASIAAPTSTDPEFGEVYESLVSAARDVTEQLREKVGAAAVMAEMVKVQKVVRERREGRRAKRAVEAVAEPEKVEREKRRKREKGKDKRRERSQHAAGMRRGW